MTTEQALTADDMRELELAPIWILAAVAGADGKIDKTEHAALAEGIKKCVAHTDELVRTVFQRVDENFDALWNRYMADERFTMHGVEAVGDVLARYPDPVQALHLKQTLFQLGIDVADASGGVLGLGKKRSKAERHALLRVAESLRMSSPRLVSASQSSFNSILVPLDGSPESEAALSLARTLETGFQSTVTLLEVVSPQRPAPVYTAEALVVPQDIPSIEAQEGAASAYLERVRATYGTPDWRVIVAQGEPADVILEQADLIDANVIVLATSGSAGLKRVFEGKVTEDIVRRADMPVLLIHAGDDEF